MRTGGWRIIYSPFDPTYGIQFTWSIKDKEKGKGRLSGEVKQFKLIQNEKKTNVYV